MQIPDPRALVQDAMRAAFPEAEAQLAQFYAMQAYHLGWRDEQLNPAAFDSGKLLRPLFCLLGCQAVGGDVRQALPVAAGIQLAHDFSLIHDDIEDNSDTRRGRRTLWNIWGLAQGINAGDGMLIVAHMSLHRLANMGVPAAVVLDVLRHFDRTILTVCEGQFLDISYEGNLQVTEDEYLAMISRKTAALLASSVSMGALVGGADEETVAALSNFGQQLGLAFQMQDDILGAWGDPEETGKPAAADLLQRKLSLPVIHALEHAEQRTTLARLYSQPETSTGFVDTVLDILDQAGSQRYTEEAAERYHHQALAALDSATAVDQQAMTELRRIANSLLKRKV